MGLARGMTRYVDRNASYLFATAPDAHLSLTHLNNGSFSIIMADIQ